MRKINSENKKVGKDDNFGVEWFWESHKKVSS